MSKTSLNKKDLPKLATLKAEVLSLKGRKNEAIDLILSVLKRDASSVELHLELLSVSKLKRLHTLITHSDMAIYERVLQNI
jgi:hypothetical protein